MVFFLEVDSHLKYQVNIYLDTNYFEANQLLSGYLSYSENQQEQIEHC